MNIEERIKSFSELGVILRNSLKGYPGEYGKTLNELIDNQRILNEWFTAENVRLSLNAIAEELTEENLTIWTARYPLLKENLEPLRVGVIMAGNIPLAGFHDFLSVLISGNKIIAKTSSKDSELILFLSDILCNINPLFRNNIEFTDGFLSNFDAVIATGSNNSSRYFEYYFGKYHNIIRKNRNSIAVIEGGESEEELIALGKDIFSYFGLGCRNVSKIYIPKDYDLVNLFNYWSSYSWIINHSKYANNYDYNKAVYLVNKDFFYDTGYLLIKEDVRLSSPVSVLYFEHYESQNAVKQLTEQLEERIQCKIGRQHTPFGKAQTPSLWDYSDAIDTIDFLLKKKIAGIL